MADLENAKLFADIEAAEQAVIDFCHVEYKRMAVGVIAMLKIELLDRGITFDYVEKD